MAGREQEAITAVIGQMHGIPTKFMEVDRGQNISNAQPLADVSLARPTCHDQHMAAHVARALLQHTDVG